MPLLGLDIGSSSVKAAVLRGTKIVGRVARAEFPTRYDGPKVEVDPKAILKAVGKVVRDLGGAATKVDAIAISVMSPAWVAMDAKGEALTPIVTHQDRRSVAEARAIEDRVGKDRHLQLAGNRPFPGGISSTSWAWFKKHEPDRVKRADLVGQLNTFLHRQITGQRVIDPSNASFTGLYKTLTLDGWSDPLCAAATISKNVLPNIFFANQIAGTVSSEGARRFSLRQGLPVMAGLVDGSAGMLLAGAKPGQLLNVSGSTDVLALCVDRPNPHEKLLTRAVGVGHKWVSVSTLAAVGTALNWVRDQFYVDLSDEKYWKLVSTLAKRPPGSRVTFDNYLAGERTSIDQHTATIGGLTLASSRDDILAALLDNLAASSAARLELLKQNNGVTFRRDVVIAGGVGRRLSKILHRDWPGQWRFIVPPDEATLRGLGTLEPTT